MVYLYLILQINILSKKVLYHCIKLKIIQNKKREKFNLNFFIGKGNYSKDQKLPEMKNYLDSLMAVNQDSWHLDIEF
ncbi:hypothetical protein LABF186_15120 [Lactobacillus amylovorus subsp. animalium]|uniref:Uncharacterized protein n=1 Tax=Lactobacillus amylovorus subsp. animalium TaxID=3378536 RepID=A0ABD0C521_LACAM|nr:hypothetical protein LABF186_15120 [Lactobacillus amylovorus]GMM16371.1 hypothetical protein LABF125_15050 [Lactobacillus amylovorus]